MPEISNDENDSRDVCKDLPEYVIRSYPVTAYKMDVINSHPTRHV